MDPDAFLENAPGRIVEALDSRGRRGQAFLPNHLPPAPDLYGDPHLRLVLSQADRELARLDGVSTQLHDPASLFVSYLRREAVLSSAIEGTHTSLADLILFEATHRHVTDEAVVSSYVHAFEYARSRLGDIGVSRRLIQETHEILMRDSDPNATTPGRFRDCMVFVGNPSFVGARFVPPPESFVPDLMENLEHYLRHAVEVPLVKIAIAHYQFETIHPFRDGNGRIGRMLISLWLQQEKILSSPMLYISAYFERRKTTYYDELLSVSQRNTWSSWLAFFLRGVEEQARDARTRTQRLVALRDDYKRRVAGPRAPASMFRLIDQLFQLPVISTREAAEISGVTYPAARATMRKLIDAGILHPDPVAVNGTKWYWARELYEELERPSG